MAPLERAGDDGPWSAARTWRVDGVSALVASALAASLQGSCVIGGAEESSELFLCFSICGAKRCGLEALALMLLQGRIPRAAAATTSLQISSVLLSVSCLGLCADAAKLSVRPRDESRTSFLNNQQPKRPIRNARVHSGILSLESLRPAATAAALAP